MKRIVVCSRCGRSRIHSARGLCASCYVTSTRTAQGRALHAATERRYRKRLGAEYNRRERERNKRRSASRKIYSRAYYQRNKERLRAYGRAYNKRNPEVCRSRDERKRVRKNGTIARLTSAEWLAQIELQDRHCFYCGEISPLEQEHRIPLAHGGAHDKTNVVGACRRCNAAKATMTEEEFRMKKLPSLLAP